MIRNREKNQINAPIKNINRVFLISVVLFFITGIIAGSVLSCFSSGKKLSVYIIEITTYSALAVPFIIFERLNFRGSKDVMLPKFNLKTLRNGLICAIITYPLMLIAANLAKAAEINSKMTEEGIISAMAGFSFPENLVRMALLPAIIEELVFRSGLFGVYSGENALTGIILSSIVFALLHCNMHQIPYALVGGIAFSYATYATDNAGTAMAAHFTVNLFSLMTAYASKYIDKYCPDKTDLIGGIAAGLFMAGGVLAAGYLLVKVYKKQVVIKPLMLKEKSLSFGGFITLSLVFAVSILLFLTFLYEGYMGFTG